VCWHGCQAGRTRASPRSAHATRIWVSPLAVSHKEAAVTRSLVSLAAAVLTVSAMYALGSAIVAHRLLLGVQSGLLLTAGIALLCSLLKERTSAPTEPGSELARREAYEAAVQSAPRLGELLVHKHGWVTEKVLARALVRQRRHGGRLGDILVEMRAITPEQLAKALLVQRPELGHTPELLGQYDEWTGQRPSAGSAS
jgi:hypothetical protein